MDNTSSNSQNFYTSEDLRTVLRMLLNQYVMWTRFYIISKISNINDIEVVKNRLLEVPRDLANIYKIYYGNNYANNVEQLFRNHIELLIDITNLLISGDYAKVNLIKEKLHENATVIATFLSQKNPYLNQTELENPFHQHIDMTLDEINRRINMEYVSDIFQYDNIEYHALMLADILWKGIDKQFTANQ
jgi:hypothetical protein